MTAAAGPLAGIRIVELDGMGPVPLAAMVLADLGCEVVRIARPPNSGQAFDDVGGLVMHRNRSHVVLDLKDAGDRDRTLELIARADGLIEGFRPGVMERLGLGPDACLARNPQLAFVRVTGWGQTGPLSARAGHDINYIALTGALGAIGPASAPPPPPLSLVGDYGGGAMFAVAGMLSAIIAARAGGTGQVVDVAMTEGAAVLTSFFHAFRANGMWRDGRGDNLLDGGAPFYRCYACADGGHVAVGALEPQFFAQLLRELGISGEAFEQFDRACWPALEAALAAAFAGRTRDDWAEAFAGTDACVTPVLGFGEAAGHPQAASRNAFVAPGGVVQPAPAPRFSQTPLGVDEARRAEVSIEAALARWRD
jgi:alpha-methylacyl-CoA racemase